MFLALLQIFGWVALGYNIKAHNIWAALTWGLASIVVAVTSTLFSMIGKINGGNSSKSQ